MGCFLGLSGSQRKKRFLEKSQPNLGFNTVSAAEPEQRGDLRITEESDIKPEDFSQANVIFGGYAFQLFKVHKKSPEVG